MMREVINYVKFSGTIDEACDGMMRALTDIYINHPETRDKITKWAATVVVKSDK